MKMCTKTFGFLYGETIIPRGVIVFPFIPFPR